MKKRTKRSTRTRPELVGLYRPPVPQAGRYRKLRLDKNENTAGFPPQVIRRMLSNISPHFLAAYPEPGPLYEKIARGHNLKVENVLVTAGSEMAIRYLFEAYLDRGDEVILLNPSFAMFEVYASLCGARRIRIDCGPDLRFDPEKIFANLSPRTKIVALANPNNPTGTVIEEADLFRIVKKAAAAGTLVLVDEAYYHFYGKSVLTKFDRHPNLVVTRTFSKACGLASVRLGYALAHSEVIAEVRKLQPIDHASGFALKLGEYILDHENLVWDYVKEVVAGKVYIAREARRLGIPTLPSCANFLLLDMGDHRERLLREAGKRGVLLPRHVRLPFANEYVRVTVGPVRQMRRLVAALKAAVKR